MLGPSPPAEAQAFDLTLELPLEFSTLQKVELFQMTVWSGFSSCVRGIFRVSCFARCVNLSVVDICLGFKPSHGSFIWMYVHVYTEYMELFLRKLCSGVSPAHESCISIPGHMRMWYFAHAYHMIRPSVLPKKCGSFLPLLSLLRQLRISGCEKFLIAFRSKLELCPWKRCLRSSIFQWRLGHCISQKYFSVFWTLENNWTNTLKEQI